MRHTFPSREVFHLYAAQAQSSAHNGNSTMSFDGDDAYSYRARIGRRVRNDGNVVAYLIGTRTYSVTTAKHIGFLYHALHGARVFTVSTMDTHAAAHQENLQDYLARVAACEGKAKRARTHADHHTERAFTLQQEAADYCQFFGLSVDSLTPEAMARYATETEAARVRAAKAAKRREGERMRALRLSLADDRARWFAGDNMQIYNYPDTLLRVIMHREDAHTVTPVVETSRGARVPVGDAEKLFRAWVAGVVEPGMRVGPYTVQAATRKRLTIGCHELEAPEIHRFAGVQGWAL